MPVWNRERRVETDAGEGGRIEERPADRSRYKRGLLRGWFTLAGVVVAGFLTWLAADSFTPAGSTSDFWIAMGLLAGAGLALGLSQLLGGWTKWGVPRISSGVFLVGWLPTAVVTGWILITNQPAGGWQQGRLEGWSDSIGVLGFVGHFSEYPGVVALVLGLVTTFILDTSGPRQHRAGAIAGERAVLDEDVHDYRAEHSGETAVEPDREEITARTGPAEDATVIDRPGRRDTP